MIKNFLLSTVLVSVTVVSGFPAQAKDNGTNVPTLVVTNQPIAEVLKNQANKKDESIQQENAVQEPIQAVAVGNSVNYEKSLYTKPARVGAIDADKVMRDYYQPVDTMASKKITELENEMYSLQGKVASSSEQLQTLEVVGQDLAANYYAAVATINTQLQSGTTPGNPRLKGRLALAEDALDTLSGNIADLNEMAVNISDLASVANFLQQQARSAYSLSGSVEEDHVNLAQLEDEVSNTSVAIERLLNNVNDNITRAATYMTTERANLRTLSLAIANGDLYGKSLASRPFSMAGSTDVMEKVNYAPSMNGVGMHPNMSAMPQTAMGIRQAPSSMGLSSPRPLIKIRFDRPDVDYTQALYMSVNDAMKRYPNSRFELVAVSPGMGNPARLAIESTKARRNAEKVLRNMVQMGVDTNRVNLANLTQDELQFNEVHLYVR